MFPCARGFVAITLAALLAGTSRASSPAFAGGALRACTASKAE